MHAEESRIAVCMHAVRQTMNAKPNNVVLKIQNQAQLKTKDSFYRVIVGILVVWRCYGGI